MLGPENCLKPGDEASGSMLLFWEEDQLQKRLVPLHSCYPENLLSPYEAGQRPLPLTVLLACPASSSKSEVSIPILYYAL